jgi:hypothetical protein
VIFAREIDAPLASLVKKIDEATSKNSKEKMCSYVVMLGNDDESMEKKLKEFSDKEKLTKTALMIENPAGPPGYKIAKAADVTVLLYVSKNVKVNRAFKKGELDEKAVQSILDDLPKILTK